MTTTMNSNGECSNEHCLFDINHLNTMIGENKAEKNNVVIEHTVENCCLFLST